MHPRMPWLATDLQAELPWVVGIERLTVETVIGAKVHILSYLEPA